MMNGASGAKAEKSVFAGVTQTFTSKLPSTIMVFASISALTACANESNGNPTPAMSSTPSNRQENGAPTKDAFAGLDACELLREATASLGYEEYKPETLESDNGCRAKKSGYGNVGSYLVDKEGIDGVAASQGTKTTTQIGGRDAVQLSGDAGRGSCYVGIAITKTTRVSVGVTLSDGTDEQACTDTKVIAEQLAPKLPQGS
ncbi:DUF3558 family protein [Amycolatopsis sp. lyj-112]|uniref:DUF3558 family protein n=1 Tax=Amycolatopsis sp. lyj-112 TaxID=2789288 RepID=UPI00397A1697